MHQHPGKQWEGRRDGRRREADRRAQRQRGLHQGHSAPVCLRRGRRPGAGRAAGAEDPALVIVLHAHRRYCDLVAKHSNISLHALAFTVARDLIVLQDAAFSFRP